MILESIESNYTWGLILILFLNLSQRKIPNSNKKRIATIWICSLMLLMEIGMVTIISREWNHSIAWGVLGLCVLIAVIFRRRVWPFRLHCVQCHAKLDWNHIIGHDDNLCQDCWDKAHPEEAAKRKEKEAAEKGITPKTTVIPDTVDEMDWDSWEPTDKCVITYLFDQDNVLMIEKKQGLGTGLINAPGGHIEEAETAVEAAIRETKEETGLEIGDLSLRGELRFQFKDGMAERAYVFFANSYQGTLKECDETRPFWIKKEAFPFDRMWEDDRLWLPAALEGKHFLGSFIFDGQTMLDHRLVITDGD
ncbi:MAG: NUDIX domain-containing protein [Sphaerochaeta sp.]|jgi:8-oxo-dGTP diphosphatase|nr:NUDIX domain-containing protein [Sphaerochaeta sp.]MCI2044839.1 NUDIX domain-containing protein [Sphaerochaeta sp.]MCI2075924.1 NUDIX domain-containing protein [Sphaerochaeta sp.]MCI2097299.1 NUDIX domain-containing protein [Sphaerochaeta sp.]MCI2104371.1 NUDIX domain-containing protein [Sphaerochaeta sp.]